MTDKEMSRTKLDELQEESLALVNGGAMLSLVQHNTNKSCEGKHRKKGVLPSCCVSY